ncbi:hypothetical protein [Streptomyces sp. 6N223]|uniref:hypothetical protein n=1 Tax=Streptomyces sp. 6N223 TaxID=3457412 RepID=UPI003FD6B38F
MRWTSATEPGTPGVPNEDYAAVAGPLDGGGGALVLLDGVTGGPTDGGCRHGVAWFVTRLGGALLELCVTRPELTLAACLARAIGRTADAHRATCDLSHPRTPQATVACARVGAERSEMGVPPAEGWGRVEYLVLSDSVLLIEEFDGAVRAVLDTRLEALRPAARRLPAGERAAFVEGRRNVAGGFFTAAADPGVAERAVTGSVERGRVRRLAAVSDGVGRWVETFGLGGWPELLTALVTRGPAAVIGEVRAAEAADGEGRAFPRGKIHDDATAVVAEWESGY